MGREIEGQNKEIWITKKDLAGMGFLFGYSNYNENLVKNLREIETRRKWGIRMREEKRIMLGYFI